jgi:hypothetical protein
VDLSGFVSDWEYRVLDALLGGPAALGATAARAQLSAAHTEATLKLLSERTPPLIERAPGARWHLTSAGLEVVLGRGGPTDSQGE